MAKNDSTNNRGFAKMKETNPKKLQNIASAGGSASSGKFGSENGADPQAAGREGAKAQPTEAKREGGKNSRRNS